MIRAIWRTILSLFLGFQHLKFGNVSGNEIYISGESDPKKINHFRDSIVFLGLNFLLGCGICAFMGKVDPSNSSLYYNIGKALLILFIPAIIVYEVLALAFKNNQAGKIVSLMLLFILVNVSAFFLGRFIYDKNVKNVLSTINYSQQIQIRQKEIDDQIDVLSQALQKDPNNRVQAYQYISMIDEMIALHKEAHEVNTKFQDTIMAAFKQESAMKPAELKRLLKEHYNLNVNLDALPEYRDIYQSWYNTKIRCLSARKSSFQSYIDDEEDHRQNLKLSWADSACSSSSEKMISMTEARAKFMGTDL